MAYMCLLTGNSTRGFHGSLWYEANAGRNSKAVAMYDSSSSLKRDPYGTTSKNSNLFIICVGKHFRNLVTYRRLVRFRHNIFEFLLRTIVTMLKLMAVFLSFTSVCS
jgi:hypothetical protein